jgi:hypothetical protein
MGDKLVGIFLFLTGARVCLEGTVAAGMSLLIGYVKQIVINFRRRLFLMVRLPPMRPICLEPPIITNPVYALLNHFWGPMVNWGLYFPQIGCALGFA